MFLFLFKCYLHEFKLIDAPSFPHLLQQNHWLRLSEGFETLKLLQVEVNRLPESRQEIKYTNGTVFRHRQWGFTGLIYDADPICMGDIKPEVCHSIFRSSRFFLKPLFFRAFGSVFPI